MIWILFLLACFAFALGYLYGAITYQVTAPPEVFESEACPPGYRIARWESGFRAVRQTVPMQTGWWWTEEGDAVRDAWHHKHITEQHGKRARKLRNGWVNGGSGI